MGAVVHHRTHTFLVTTTLSREPENYLSIPHNNRTITGQ